MDDIGSLKFLILLASGFFAFMAIVVAADEWSKMDCRLTMSQNHYTAAEIVAVCNK